MEIITNVDAITDVEKYDVVLVGTSVYGMMANGFQKDICKKYPYVHEENIKQPYGDLRRLGTRLTLKKEGNPTISLLYICKYPLSHMEYLDKDALRHALLTADAEFTGKKVMTTIIGASKYDGRCDKGEMLSLISETVKGMKLYVYDYEQRQYVRDTRKKVEKSI